MPQFELITYKLVTNKSKSFRKIFGKRYLRTHQKLITKSVIICTISSSSKKIRRKYDFVHLVEPEFN